MKNSVSIVIPVYNAEASIFALVDALVGSLKMPLEIVLVNDGSQDASDRECLRASKAHPAIVTYLSLSKNSGEHNAVMGGLHYVTGDYIVIMDDDFQNPPSEVNRMVAAAIKGNYDVVYSFYEKKWHHFFRNIGSKFNNIVANRMLKKPSDLYLSSFKVISFFVAKEIIKYESPFPYIDGLILRMTSNIGTLKVAHEPRREGRSNYTLTKLIRLWLSMFTNFSILPLRIATILGGAVGVVGLFFAAYSVYERFNNPNLPLGWTTLMVVVCLFSSAQLISIGLLGEYLGRVFMSLNKAPQFTVRHAYLRQKD